MNLKYGIASPSTITRMLNGIDEELALYAFMEWIGEIVESRNTHLAIDGKALCGATEKTKGETSDIHLRIVIMNRLSLTRVSEITFAFRHWMSWQENHIF